MRDLLLLAIHLLVTLAKFLGPGGVRRVAAESLLLKHQLLISNRSRQRAPNLTMLDRLVLGLTTLFVSPHRIPKLSASLKPATLFNLHKALVHRKYHLLFSSSCRRRKPGPKGPSAQLIAGIVEMKHRNLKFGCVRIAQQIARAFGIEIDEDHVRARISRREQDVGGSTLVIEVRVRNMRAAPKTDEELKADARSLAVRFARAFADTIEG
jgi:putative transposase